MTCVLDTSAYSAFNRGDARLKKWFRASTEIIVPLVVVGELRAGFAAGDRQEANERLLQRFLDAPNVTTATLTDVTTKFYAQLYFKLRQAGTPMGTNDMWIAAIALERSTPLLTLDADFSRASDVALAKI